MKIRLIVATAAFVMAITSTVYAGGIPVIDVSNLAQAITQVQHMVEQIEKLQAQLDKAQETLDSMTGSRGFGSGFNSGQYDAVLEEKFSEVLSEYNIKDATSWGIDGASSEFFDKGNENAANYLKRSLDSLNQAKERFTDLQGLIGGIDSAADQKAILDLQARIAGEQALLENERIKLAAMKAEAEAHRQVQERQANQMRLEVAKPADFTW